MRNSVDEYFDVSQKLKSSEGKSLFEKQREEAERKRIRAEKETAEVYHDFVKSFEDDQERPPFMATGSRGDGTLGGFRGNSGGASGPRRHFTQSYGPRLSGPGSLGPVPSLAKKRTYEDFPSSHRDRDRDLKKQRSRRALSDSDEEDQRGASDIAAEHAPPKPTLHLASMPPGTSVAVIKNLIPPKLKVEGVRFLPLTDQSRSERQSASAIIVLAAETTSTDIDTVVSALQKTYLGKGFYLSISRHVSTNALGLAGVPPPPVHTLGNAPLPFGAKSIHPVPTGPMHRAPPGNFAPPPSYGTGGAISSGRLTSTQVQVTPPSDLNQLKLIHKTVEALIRHGPEFEAVLMNRPDVQKEKKWDWIWDPNSVGGIWYRWKLWTLWNQLELDGSHSSDRDEMKRLRDSLQHVFEGTSPWVRSQPELKFEFLDEFEDFITDSEYDSDDEDSDDEESRRRKQTETTYGEEDGPSYLNPLEKSRLAFLLARLPKTSASLRKGDIARITIFAISHASAGFEEVVDMLVLNILRPYNWTMTYGDKSKTEANDADEADKKAESDDPSYAKLVGLYTISDILATSSTAGVRHAWRYRTAFELALKERKVFEHLGRLDRDLGWGRMRTDRWRNSIDTVLRRWRDVNLFLDETHNHFTHAFANPPLTEAEKAAEAAAKAKEAEAESARAKQNSKVHVEAPSTLTATKPMEKEDHVAGEPVMNEDIDGEPMTDSDENIDGEPMTDSDEDIDGKPMTDSDKDPVDQKQLIDKSQPEAPIKGFSMSIGGQKDQQGGLKRRPRAEDLFPEVD